MNSACNRLVEYGGRLFRKCDPEFVYRNGPVWAKGVMYIAFGIGAMVLSYAMLITFRDSIRKDTRGGRKVREITVSITGFLIFALGAMISLYAGITSFL